MKAIERLHNSGVIPVVVIDRAEDAIPAAKALLAGGVDVTLYPRSEREKATGYSGIRLTAGDRITVQGGMVRLFAEDE